MTTLFHTPGLVPKGPLLDTRADVGPLARLLLGQTTDGVFPDAYVYEHYLSCLTERIDRGETPPPSEDPLLPCPSGVYMGFAARNPREFRAYLRSWAELAAEVANTRGYRFSWGSLFEHSDGEATLWDFLPGELLRHAQHAGIPILGLECLARSWGRTLEPPRGIAYTEGAIGLFGMIADSSQIRFEAARRWLGRTFVPEQLPQFFGHASELLAHSMGDPFAWEQAAEACLGHEGD